MNLLLSLLLRSSVLLCLTYWCRVVGGPPARLMAPKATGNEPAVVPADASAAVKAIPDRSNSACADTCCPRGGGSVESIATLAAPIDGDHSPTWARRLHRLVGNLASALEVARRDLPVIAATATRAARRHVTNHSLGPPWVGLATGDLVGAAREVLDPLSMSPRRRPRHGCPDTGTRKAILGAQSSRAVAQSFAEAVRRHVCRAENIHLDRPAPRHTPGSDVRSGHRGGRGGAPRAHRRAFPPRLRGRAQGGTTSSVDLDQTATREGYRCVLGGRTPALVIGLLVVWCAGLSVLQLTEPRADEVESYADELAGVDAELIDWQEEAEEAFAGAADRLASLDRRQVQAMGRIDQIEERASLAASAAIQRDNEMRAVSGLLASVGQRLDLADREMQQLSSALFGVSSPTFEFDAVGNLESCVNGNFADLARELSDFGTGFLNFENC